MPAVIARSYFESLSKLDGQSHQRANDFVIKFQENPAHPGVSLERAQQALSNDVWSARVSRDLRAIIYRDGPSWVLLYVGHHDGAYGWVRSRRVERHVKTGALQIVEAPTVVEEPRHEQQVPSAKGLFDKYGDDYLLSLGVPPTWLSAVRSVSSDDALLELLPKLPEDVGDRLFDLAVGKVVTPPAAIGLDRPVTDSADTLRSFFLIESNDDLDRLLAAPLATWLVFLHPSQRRLADGSFKGPLKVTGSAGTGKTVVAMHRARHLARQGKRVLLTSYVRTLCHNIESNLKLLCTPEEMKRIKVSTVHSQAMELVQASGEAPNLIQNEDLGKLIEKYAALHGSPLQTDALLAEWDHVVQAQSITDWEQYRAANRAGRGRPLTVKERKTIWIVFDRVQQELRDTRRMDYTGLCKHAVEVLQQSPSERPFDAVIVDEVQDLGPQELRFVASLAGVGTDALTLVGDGGQRIYASRFSFRSLGIDVRGRSHILRLNYRTSDQIRRLADQVLGSDGDDLDGGREERSGTRSLFSGPTPLLEGFESDDEQVAFIVKEIQKAIAGGRKPDEIAVFARSARFLDPIEKQLSATGISNRRLSRDAETTASGVNLGTMHRAKGMEFKVVFVSDVSDNLMPLASVIRRASDDQLRQDALEVERQLLYVSMTRARDQLFVTWFGKPSRFLPASST